MKNKTPMGKNSLPLKASRFKDTLYHAKSILREMRSDFIMD